MGGLILQMRGQSTPSTVVLLLLLLVAAAGCGRAPAPPPPPRTRFPALDQAPPPILPPLTWDNRSSPPAAEGTNEPEVLEQDWMSQRLRHSETIKQLREDAARRSTNDPLYLTPQQLDELAKGEELLLQ